MQSPQQHENHHYQLYREGMVKQDGFIPGTESPGGYRAERMIYGIEQIHAGNQKGNGFQQIQTQVYGPDNHDGLFGAEPVILFRQGGNFHFAETHPERTDGRQNKQHENDDPDSPDKMGG